MNFVAAIWRIECKICTMFHLFVIHKSSVWRRINEWLIEAIPLLLFHLNFPTDQWSYYLYIYLSYCCYSVDTFIFLLYEEHRVILRDWILERADLCFTDTHSQRAKKNTTTSPLLHAHRRIRYIWPSCCFLYEDLSRKLSCCYQQCWEEADTCGLRRRFPAL